MTKLTYLISGRVINRELDRGIPSLRIETWDKNLIFNDLVGSTMTDAERHFQIEFTESYFQECFLDRRPDLFFKVFRDSELIASTEDLVL